MIGLITRATESRYRYKHRHIHKHKHMYRYKYGGACATNDWVDNGSYIYIQIQILIWRSVCGHQLG